MCVEIVVENVDTWYAIPGWGCPHLASAPEAQEYLTRLLAEQMHDALNSTPRMN